MTGSVVFTPWYTRADALANPTTLYVFGDNIGRRGRGGQAAELRGLPNAVGIPTKWAPNMTSGAFFRDSDLAVVQSRIDKAFATLTRHVQQGGDVVWPEAGIGTGYAELPTRAPKIHAHICAQLSRLLLCAAGTPPSPGAD